MEADQKIAFALSPDGQGDGIPILMLGISQKAWEYMKDGKTHTFDLTSIGVPIKLVLFGASSRAAVVKLLEEACAASGSGVLHMPRVDFSIKPKTISKSESEG